MKTTAQIKSWYRKANASDLRSDNYLACEAYQNGLDTYPEGEAHPDFWRVVDDSRQILIDSGFVPQD